MTQPSTLLTAEEFWIHYADKDFPLYELAKGELVEMAPPGGIHGGIAANITMALGLYVHQNNLGRIMVETGFHLERDPDTVRGPDVSFIRADRISAEGLPRGFIPGAPDLAVEVVSPSDAATEVEAKVHDYLRNGSQRVWVVYSTPRRVVVYSRNGSVRWFHEDDILEDEELFPGFALPLRDLFTFQG